MSSDDKQFTTRLDNLTEDFELAEKKAREHNHVDDAIIPWVVELRVTGTPDIIQVPLGDVLTLGRADRELNYTPQIDLSAYRAHALGVSRKHATMIMRDNRLTLVDLDSANGTFVNGRKIGPKKPMRIRDGDHIKLGNLMLQIHYIVQPHTNEDTLPGIGNEIDVPKIGSGQRILLLDDNEEVCAVLRVIAKKAGFDVVATHSTAAAITEWDNREFDAVFVELMLDDSNGLDFVDYIHKHTQKAVTIIATNSTVGGYRENQARAKGVDNLIIKPLSVDKIMAALRQIVHSSPNTQQS